MILVFWGFGWGLAVGAGHGQPPYEAGLAIRRPLQRTRVGDYPPGGRGGGYQVRHHPPFPIPHIRPGCP